MRLRVQGEGGVSKLFAPPTSKSDPDYVTIATSDWTPAIDARRTIEDLWPRVEPFLDRDFAAKLSRSFHSHFWELYLSAALIKRRFTLVPRSHRTGSDLGPDFILEDGTSIEAVTITPGTGADEVLEGEMGKARSVPDDGIRLRLLNAISKKSEVFTRYAQKGVHDATRPFVIALNGANVPSSRLEQPIPRIVRALYPIGPFQAHFDTRTMEIVDTSYATQTTISKASGSTVQTDGFVLADGLKGVSAVLYSCVDAVNMPNRIGQDFVVVHNMNASVPIERRVLPACTEYFVSEGRLLSQPGVGSDDAYPS